MPNVNNPRGFSPVHSGPGLTMNYYAKTSAKIMYPGDAVVVRSDGLAYTAGTNSTTIAGVAAAYAATAARQVLVYNDPNQQYYIQDDGIAATLTPADIGAGFSITVSPGSATWNKSTHALDTSTRSTGTAARPLLLLGLHPDDQVGKYVRCRVTFNKAMMLQTRGSVFV
jgi:hypothetical protein